MKAAERHEHAARAIGVGDAIGAVRARDVHLDDDQVRRICGRQRLDVLIDEGYALTLRDGLQLERERVDAWNRKVTASRIS